MIDILFPEERDMDHLTDTQQEMVDNWHLGYVLDHTTGSNELWPTLFDPESDYQREPVNHEIYTLEDLEAILPIILKDKENYGNLQFARPQQLPLILKYDDVDVSQGQNRFLMLCFRTHNFEALKCVITHPKFHYDFSDRETSMFTPLSGIIGRQGKNKTIKMFKYALRLMSKDNRLGFIADLGFKYGKKMDLESFKKIVGPTLNDFRSIVEKTECQRAKKRI